MTITFPDAELWATGYVRAFLNDGTYVSNRKPTELGPDRIVTLRRNGGIAARRMRRFDRVRLGVNVWAPTDFEANELAAKVRAAFLKAHDEGVIKDAIIAGPAEVAPDGTEKPRRYFTVEYTARGTQS